MKHIFIKNTYDTARDGGTVRYEGLDGETYYYKDGRIGTNTPGAIYDRYPGDMGAVILEDVVLVAGV